MTRPLARLLLFAAAVAGGAVAASCVEIATGPGGIVAVRLVPVPPSIVAGDTLRDSNAATVRLRAVGFDGSGDTVRDAEFRYVAIPIAGDTAAQKTLPLVVDSLTGFVRALGPVTSTRRVRLAARLGDRLQVLDTITIVKPPTRLARVATNDTSTVLRMGYECNDSGRVVTLPTTARVGLGPNDSVPFGTAQPMAVRLTADSTDTLRAVVPDYYVRWEIVSPTSIPTGPVRGVTRPALSIISSQTSDRATNTDTTDGTGTSTAYLRVIAPLLKPSAGARVNKDSLDVRVRASARTRPNTVVPAPVEFVVRLRRIDSLTSTNIRLSGPGCP